MTLADVTIIYIVGYLSGWCSEYVAHLIVRSLPKGD